MCVSGVSDDCGRRCASAASEKPRVDKCTSLDLPRRRSPALNSYDHRKLLLQTHRSNRWLEGCTGSKASLHAEETRVVSLTFHPGTFPRTVFPEFTHLDSVISAGPSVVVITMKQIAGPLRETRSRTSRKLQTRNRPKVALLQCNVPDFFSIGEL